MERQTALITGASGGIGLEFARVFACEGYHLVLVARSEEKLQALAAELSERHGITARPIALDLSLPESPQMLFDLLAGTPVDVLVNNAGFATYGRFAETDLQRELELLQLNMVALTHLTKLFLRPMLARRRGRILNVASTAAFQPGPLMAVYYASKAYVLSFTEAIACELQGTGVSASALCPGPTESGFQQRAAMQESRLVQGGMMAVGPVVEAGYRGLMAGQTVIVPGLTNQIGSILPRLVPRTWVARLVMRLQERVDAH